MPIEVFTYVSTLDSAYPLGSDTKSTLDDHQRGVKAALVASFPNIAGAMTATHTQLNYLAAATGTTGTTSTNLVYSTSPTITSAALVSPTVSGTLAGAASTWSGNVAVSGTLSNPGGFQTATLSGNVDYVAVWQGSSTAGGASQLYTDTGFTFNPSTGNLKSTKYNGLTVTASTGTFTLTNAKTLAVSNSLTFTGTDSSSVAFGTGGTVAYTVNKLSVFAATTSAELAGVISDETGSGALVFGTSPTIATAVLNGTITGTSQATANTASTLVMRDASGNFSAGTITAALSGNATTATALATSRTIWGQAFTGAANVSGAMTGVTTITMSGQLQIDDGVNGRINILNEASYNSINSALTGFSDWKPIRIKGNGGVDLLVGSTIAITGAATVSSTFSVSGATTLAGLSATTISGTTGAFSGTVTSTAQTGFTVNPGAGASKIAIATYTGTNAASASRTGYVGINVFGTDGSLELMANASGQNVKIGSAGTAAITASDTAVAITPAVTMANGCAVTGALSATTNIQPLATPSTNWGVDFAPVNASGNNLLSIANNGTYDLAAGSGLVVLHDDGDGNPAIFLLGAGVVTVISDPGGVYSNTSATGSKVNVFYNAGTTRYRIENKRGSTRSIWVTMLRTRFGV